MIRNTFELEQICKVTFSPTIPTAYSSDSSDLTLRILLWSTYLVDRLSYVSFEQQRRLDHSLDRLDHGLAAGLAPHLAENQVPHHLQRPVGRPVGDGAVARRH